MKDKNGIGVAVGDKAVVCSQSSANDGRLGVVKEITPSRIFSGKMHARIGGPDATSYGWSSWCEEDEFVAVKP